MFYRMFPATSIVSLKIYSQSEQVSLLSPNEATDRPGEGPGPAWQRTEGEAALPAGARF